MEITAINQRLAYQNSVSAIQQTTEIKTAEPVRRDAPAYRVNISSTGRSRSLSSFNRTQQLEKSSFQRSQTADAASNERKLANEQAAFERKQAAEERDFENSQNQKKAKFTRTINRNPS